jgi:hypothetical protein
MARNSGSHKLIGDLFLQNAFRPAIFARPQGREVKSRKEEVEGYHLDAAKANAKQEVTGQRSMNRKRLLDTDHWL